MNISLHYAILPKHSVIALVQHHPKVQTGGCRCLTYIKKRFGRFLNVSGCISVMSLLPRYVVKQERRTKMTLDNVEIESTRCWSTQCSQYLKFSTFTTASHINNILNVGYVISSNGKEQWTFLKIVFSNLCYVVILKIPNSVKDRNNKLSSEVSRFCEHATPV